MTEPTATISEIATATVNCRRCGALPGELCATAMKRAREQAGDQRAVAELEDLESAGPRFLHPERLKMGEELVQSAVNYGLVRRVPGGGEG
jgi:hypothetical protein